MRTDPAGTYATVVGAGLVLFGLTGFFYNSSFATSNELIADKAFGLFYVNGWQNLLHLAAGLIGLSLSPLLPRLYCAASGVIWTVLAAGGFFGAHGGEAIPAIGGLIPAGTANNLLCLALAILAFAATAATSKPREKAKREPNSKPKVEPEAEAGPERPKSSSVGRPRTALRRGAPRRTIN